MHDVAALGKDYTEIHPATEAAVIETERMRVVPHVLDLKYQEE